MQQCYPSNNTVQYKHALQEQQSVLVIDDQCAATVDRASRSIINESSIVVYWILEAR